MTRRRYSYALIVIAATIFCLSVPAFSAGPKGAKAIFDSGEGPSVQVAVKKAPGTSTRELSSNQKYVGISYELLLLRNDGQMQKVTKNRTFTSGERIIMKVMTNRSGNLKIYNVGPTGNTNVLYDDFVNAYAMTQVPANTNFRFVGDPGTETLLIMLSEAQAPAGTNPPVSAGAENTAQAPAAASGIQPPQGNEPSQVAGIAKMRPTAPSNLPSATVIASNIEGSKKIRGSKDIVVEDGMQSSFSVVSPRNKWQPVRSGKKDIVVESNNGTNYGVVPVSAVSDGGILSLTVKLKHR